MVGFIAKIIPVPIYVPPHVPEYQNQFDPDANEPPETYKESVPPEQIIEA